MLKEGLEYLFGKVQANKLDVRGLPYSDKALTIIETPLADEVRVETLGALVALATAGLDGLEPDKCFAQVSNASTVRLNSLLADEFGNRRCFVAAIVSNPCPFIFGRFHEPEQFIIGLQSCFVEDPALKSLLALCSSLTAENVAVAEDDGVSQVATLRSGIALKSNKKIEPKVKLRPFRTFREIEQPASTFLFRLRSRDGAPPECALFEADGGAWLLEAVKNIGGYLRRELPEGTEIIF